MNEVRDHRFSPRGRVEFFGLTIMHFGVLGEAWPLKMR
jgi:hypothetical protein